MARMFMCEDDDSRMLMVTHYYFSTRHGRRGGTGERRIKRGLGCLRGWRLSTLEYMAMENG